ncbi:hypothetical protein DMH01_19135 [Amycolatopsis sp. WAC 04182]|uniref:hypothetical protein n=1 Tax=Amycolatopsis sp. WAC 04182 TaxID=2203198 RepID=UPI000F7B16E7|nr:hypothetical protein [Amycolatopsis sp. WAC 04182]RSN61329.1 hypothetical protein DMH01_19135 [Amycolatopsis sp. WAC 04182]
MNPISGLPLIGDLFGLLDEAADRLGFALWFRILLGFVYAAAFGYLVAWLVVTYVVPWAGNALRRPVRKVAEGLRFVLLVPDWALSRAFRRAGHIPPQVVYDYGGVVMRIVDRIQEVTDRGLPKLAGSRAAPPWLLLVFVAFWFLVWGTSLPR